MQSEQRLEKEKLEYEKQRFELMKLKKEQEEAERRIEKSLNDLSVIQKEIGTTPTNLKHEKFSPQVKISNLQMGVFKIGATVAF